MWLIKFPKIPRRGGGGWSTPSSFIEISVTLHFFLQLTTKTVPFLEGPSNIQLLRLKFSFFQRIKRGFHYTNPQNETTNDCFFGKVCYLHICLESAHSCPNFLSIKKEESKYETKFKSELLLMKFINMK